MTIAATVGASALLVATAGFAGGPDHYAMPMSNGVYGEFNLGYGNVDDGDSGLTGNIAIGYKYNVNWAAEAGYALFPRSNGSSANAFHAAIKGIYPIGNGWDVYGKLGPAIAHGSRNSANGGTTRLVAYLGVGATKWFSQRLGAQVEFNTTTRSGNCPSMYAITVGGTYFF